MSPESNPEYLDLTRRGKEITQPMNKKTGVDIILPMYNSEVTIEETVRSIQNQSFGDWDLWIADDVSTDSSRDIVQGLSEQDSRIHLLQGEKNFGGPAEPRNRAIAAGKNPYIAFIDSDDLWEAHKLELQLKILEESPELTGTCTNFRFFPKGYGNGLWIFRDRTIALRSLLEAPLSWKKRSLVVNSSVMMRRSVVQAVGPIDEDPELISTEDYDYWVRVLCYRDNSMLLLKEDLVHYRIHEGSITGLSHRSDLIYQRLDKVFSKVESEDISNLRERLRCEDGIQRFRMDFYRGLRSWSELMRSGIGISNKFKIGVGYLLKKWGFT